MDELHAQLVQLQEALESADDESKLGIQMLISDLQELLNASTSGEGNKSITHFKNQEHGSEDQHLNEDDEFMRFQAEIASLDNSGPSASSSILSGSTDSRDKSNSSLPAATISTEAKDDEEEETGTKSIEEELKALEGMKCSAPFEHHWGQTGYYSGIIICAEHSQTTTVGSEICVRVLFTQPIVESMKPCTYYLEGHCRFTETCKFSHGEVVSLSDLREYNEPDYSRVIPGAKVMAKYSDGLWYKASVSKLKENGECEIRYESYKDEIVTVPLHETIPIDDDDDDNCDGSTSDDEDFGDNSASNDESENDTAVTPIRWIHMNGTKSLGDWEQHTKGIGSKLMAKMGYVFGTGLGKDGEGRVHPVDAVILPPGRSLDRCMELKEKAGSSGENLFSVERRLKRMKQKEMLRAKAEERKEKEQQSVFNFLNLQLNLRKSKTKLKNSPSSSRNFNKDSCKDLSKTLLTIGESIKSVEKDIAKCKDSIRRHEGRDQTTADRMKAKIQELECQLKQFRNNENLITKEQNNRVAKKKLTLF